MNKTAIKNFAVRARNRLKEDITQKSYELGITKDEIKDIETFEGGFKIKGLENSRTYKKYELKQRERLISSIKDRGFEQVVEEVAYTWFNRFIALRFMEVNEYLPTGIRVLSSIEEGKTEPDIIKEALNVDLDIDHDIVYKIIDNNDTEDLYKYLFIKQCNQLGQIMPMVFEEISDYTELLLPDNLLAEGSVIRDLVESVDEEDYKDQVEIIGWMYQYYISEKKDEVFADLKKNVKITKENIPAATQLFTPKWIVKYMVENSLGRLWLESHPDEELQAQWKYYLEEAEQDPEVQKQLDELKNSNLNPKDIKVLDPAMGSGHILVYAFDVLYDIYLKANYSEREIPQLILENNIYGLDIDDRAGQLAAFALMMKARSKNRRIFRNKIELNICSIQESNGIPKEAIEFLVSPKDTALEEHLHKEEVEYLVEVFHDAKEYGSILDVKKIDFNAIEKRLEEIRNGETLDLYELQYRDVILEKLPPLIKQGRIMSQKYDVVCTNPPYMGNMPTKMLDYVVDRYEDSKYDLYSVFMEKSYELVRNHGYVALITQHSWMFISSFINLRVKVLRNRLLNILHLGSRAFESIGGEVVQTVAFIFIKQNINDYLSQAKRLVEYGSQNQKENMFFYGSNNNYSFRKEDFYKLSGVPIAYWLSHKYYDAFDKAYTIDQYALRKAGIVTGDDKYFLKIWFEVKYDEINFQPKDSESYSKYHIMSKGGSHRRFYGNYEYVIRLNDLWDTNKTNKSVRRGDKDYYFKEAIGWSQVGNTQKSFRMINNSVCGTATPTIYIDSEKLYFYILAFLNTKVAFEYLSVFNPTMNLLTTDICNLPLIINEIYEGIVEKLVKSSICISKADWDSFEISWDFKRHPLIEFRQNKALWGDPSPEDFRNNGSIDLSYKAWEYFMDTQFNQLKSNEEELNRIFIEIYGLQDELTPEVEDKDITIRKADRERDIKSFISYAVGCMFGRYSLDEEGLIYAGGEFDIDRYKTFIPTRDNILIIADDEYFEDDIVNRFVEFVKSSFGKDTLEENLNYIADTLGDKAGETSRQTIRRYFLKDFYNDHVKTYQKRPIYWQFDSGKQNGFKALIYMHRYDSLTVARVRTDYLHKLQKQYEAEVNRMDVIMESEVSTREKAAAKKRKDNINKQILECRAYDQVIAHIANQRVEIDLDDGVVVNYSKFQGVQIPQGEGKKPLKADLLAKI